MTEKKKEEFDVLVKNLDLLEKTKMDNLSDEVINFNLKICFLFFIIKSKLCFVI